MLQIECGNAENPYDAQSIDRQHTDRNGCEPPSAYLDTLCFLLLVFSILLLLLLGGGKYVYVWEYILLSLFSNECMHSVDVTCLVAPLFDWVTFWCVILDVSAAAWKCCEADTSWIVGLLTRNQRRW